MKDLIEDIFYEVVRFLIDKQYIQLQNYFLDSTKIKANANKDSFVWNKSVRNYDQKLDEKIKSHLREIDRIVAEENHIYLEEDLEEKGENTRITAHGHKNHDSPSAASKGPSGKVTGEHRGRCRIRK